MDKRRRARLLRGSELEQWLLRYQDALAEEALISQRIDTLDSYAKRTTHHITGMPGYQGDGSLIPALSDEREKLRCEVSRSQQIRGEILAAIERLPNDERRLLTAYYIEGMSLERAAEFVPCSTRSAGEIKKTALLRLGVILGQQSGGD